MKLKKSTDGENMTTTKKKKKKKKKTTGSKNRRSSSSSKSQLQSKSKSKTMAVPQQQRQRQQQQQQETTEENPLRAKYGFTKRIGSAYKRSDASIITDGNTTVADQNRRHNEDERSIPGTDTCSTGSASSTASSSAGEHDECTRSMASMTLQDDTLTRNSFVTHDDTRDDVTTRTVDNASVTTDNVAMKGGFGWFQPTLNRAFMKKVAAGHDVPSSPSNSSVVAVKKSIKSKFDYIRAAQRFSTNNYVDPPADQSIRTTHSVKADEAAAANANANGNANANANGVHKSPIDNRTQQQRRSDLAKQILQRRTITAVDHHESGANTNHLSRVDP